MKAIKKLSNPKISGSIILVLIVLFPLLYPAMAESRLSPAGSFLSGHLTYSYIVPILVIFFSVSSIIILWRKFDGQVLMRFMLLVFGSSISATAIFAHMGVYNGLDADVQLNTAYSYFAVLAVISFSALALSSAILQSESKGRLISFLSAITVIISALAQNEAGLAHGQWQRIILSIFIGWIIYISSYSEL
jgi:hypothetical protein